MRTLILSLGIATLLCTGCGQGYRNTSLYTLSGRQKPIVAVLPVIDDTGKCTLQWDLSRELTDEIRNRIYKSRNLYLLREGGSREIARALSTPNPQGISRKISDSLGAAEFAVVTEIIEQDEESFGLSRAPKNHPIKSEIGSVITLALRVRVIDLRKDTPKVILQEVLDQDFLVSRAYMNCDYEKMAWGTEAFNHTPMGMAHNRLIKQVVSHSEAYIEAAL